MNNKPALIGFFMLLLFISGSIWLVFEYVSAEKQRDLDGWQARLNIMAESQHHAVDKWFGVQVENINELAANPLMQLYISQSVVSSASKDETSRGQLGHLRNLLNASAARAGVFTSIEKIKSNRKNNVSDGLAIVNDNGVLLATRYFPVDAVVIQDSYRRALGNKGVYISDIYNAGGDVAGRINPRVIIVVPVNSVQSLRSRDFRGAVIAVINPEDNLYRLLLKEWITTDSEETILVSHDDTSVQFLSPLKNGYSLFHSSGLSGVASAAVIKSNGSFVIAPDYRNINVLATARNIKNTSMQLIQKIDVKEALAEATEHQNFILTVFLLLVFVVTLSFIAIWRHATSLHLQKATRRLRARAELLNAIGDSINDHTFLLDHKNKLVFINNSLAKSFSIENIDVRRKSLNHVFNNEITDKLLALKPVDATKTIRNQEMRLKFRDKRHDYHVSVIALRHPDYKQSFLYVMHDITELKDAQGKHNRLMDGIITTLAQVIDKHDPHCAHHSDRTREVAIAVASAMGLSQDRIDTLAMAALLANIGKLHIPAEMLISEEPLTEAEELVMREHINHSVDILQGLEFGGPVIDFVQQKNECLDGSGYPNGISGEAIAQESRILSVANAFVAMTSSRAYRSGKPIKEVLDVLLSEADTRYDRNVIAALFHIAENHSDWERWQQVE